MSHLVEQHGPNKTKVRCLHTAIPVTMRLLQTAAFKDIEILVINIEMRCFQTI